MTDDRTIYLVGADGALVSMQQQPYDSEDILQQLLATHPNLLSGGREGGSRWLLIAREMSVPDQQDGYGRWSLDHMFIDDQAIPTLVEVKRASDSRIRREVIGQLLDYAANGTEYWPPGEMRRTLEERKRSSEDADADVQQVLGQDPDDFWELAEANLRSGRVRLIVLADVIPKELQRIIEFLNERMPDTQVLAMEVRQYLGQGQRTLVPRVIGNTTTAQRAKQADRGPGYGELLDSAAPETRKLEQLLLGWTQARGGVTKPARTSLAFWVDDRHVVRLYPVDNSLEFMLNRVRVRGLVNEAQDLKRELQAMCPSHPLSDRHLYLPAPDLVRHWEEFEHLLGLYLTYLDLPEPSTSAPTEPEDA